jgi:hypothetical protein
VILQSSCIPLHVQTQGWKPHIIILIEPFVGLLYGDFTNVYRQDRCSGFQHVNRTPDCRWWIRIGEEDKRCESIKGRKQSASAKLASCIRDFC